MTGGEAIHEGWKERVEVETRAMEAAGERSPEAAEMWPDMKGARRMRAADLTVTLVHPWLYRA